MKPRDVDVVTFQPNGLVAINPELESNPTEVARFEATRDCYHLDWPKIKEARTTLYNCIVRWIERGEQCALSQDRQRSSPLQNSIPSSGIFAG